MSNGTHSRSNSASSTKELQGGKDKVAAINGTATPDVTQLQRELEKAREEKDALATQYNTLLAKLTDMRTKLGSKLEQDAEELDRREQLIQSLTTQNEDLMTTVDTLKDELITSNSEAERISRELDTLRTGAFQENTHESMLRERELREAQLDLETCRMEREEWERMALHEKAIAGDSKSTVETLQRDLELERDARERESTLLQEEREKSENLQSVLLDFQIAKDHEVRQAIKDYEAQVLAVTQSLAEYKYRAHSAELKLEETDTDIGRTQELERELKKKNLLIGKLQHETVIINEHLVEALRRLRKNSSETNVDRRLVTNVILSFIATPRGDNKRFEMLNLLSSILSWTDQEREKAGLQRQSHNTLSSPSSGFWGRSLSSGLAHSSVKSAELTKSDETESFSRLWVEFLLTESSSDSPANGGPPRSNGSLPNSPTGTTHSLSPPTNTRNLSSLSSSATNLLGLVPSPNRKGKEKEVS